MAGAASADPSQQIIPLTFIIPNTTLTTRAGAGRSQPQTASTGFVVIDLASEQLVSLHDVPKLLPPRPNGKRVHISAIYRWVQRGIRGIRLEVIRVGGTTYTSREALQRFSSPTAALHDTANLSTAARQRQIDRAVQRLDRILYHGRVNANPRSNAVAGPIDQSAVAKGPSSSAAPNAPST
jgi:hypothetical protein